MSDLIPRKVFLQGSFKSIRLNNNTSDGTEIGIEFDVPEGMTPKEVRRACFEEHKRLHKYAVTVEHLKDTVPYEDFRVRIKTINERFDGLLNGKQPDAGAGGTSGDDGESAGGIDDDGPKPV